MTISEANREFVRQRARHVCEYCGLREADVGGEFTIDHFQPRSKGGSDEVENLVYSCFWCNQRKLDYWPATPTALQLWNPRRSHAHDHFLILEDGSLRPLTEDGAFTSRRLHLNRPALIAWRLRQRYQDEQNRLLTQYRNLLALQTQLVTEMTTLLQEQQTLLTEQQIILNHLLRHR